MIFAREIFLRILSSFSLSFPVTYTFQKLVQFSPILKIYWYVCAALPPLLWLARILKIHLISLTRHKSRDKWSRWNSWLFSTTLYSEGTSHHLTLALYTFPPSQLYYECTYVQMEMCIQSWSSGNFVLFEDGDANHVRSGLFCDHVSLKDQLFRGNI